MLHHAIAIGGIFGGTYSGYGVPGIGAMSLMTELSTFFLNIREMYSKDDLNLPVPATI
jgi:hypothetical protein|tara:strand:- start:429 stop:602 length:174 start_codon:yes stop_codon:yes gene_type:complete